MRDPYSRESKKEKKDKLHRNSLSSSMQSSELFHHTTKDMETQWSILHSLTQQLVKLTSKVS